MTSKISRLAPLFFILSLTLLLSACGKTPSARFYTLAALAESAGEKAEPSSRETRRIVAVGPVALPAYLDHLAITTRAGTTVLKRSELDRWGGSLPDDTGRVLIENLERLLPGNRFLVLPWLETATSDYRTQLNITRFDGPTAGPVELHAAWLIFTGNDPAPVASGSATFVEPLAGEGFAATTEAMSRALLGLSRRIADEIRNIPKR
ncbi:PqiC family protein [Trichloromonas sp.]|uniref:PqiC family protein n=1 Tax=Trichloromonas sp. TaxID=3069249 RepID=UPI002A4CCA38|nr:PqiC family protein [Trichloromonas sp.]